MQYHFATILSPWVRRALIAGGFGTGVPASNAPTEIAPVVPYRGGQLQTSPNKSSDVESPEDRTSKDSGVEEYEPIEPEVTPFFHFDIVSAVRAAEVGLSRRESTSTIDKDYNPKSDVDITLSQ